MAPNWQVESFTRYKSWNFKKTTLPEKWRDIIGVFVAEFMGTSLLIMFGCLSFCKETLPSEGEVINNPNWFLIGYGYGAVVMFLTAAFVHVSGAFMNPVVTIWAVIYGVLPILLAPIYMLAQFTGAIVGYYLLKITMPETKFHHKACINYIDERFNKMQAFFMEFLTTALLIFVYCGVWDHRSEQFIDTSPIKIGLTYNLLITVTGISTQSGMNPARTLAASIYSGHWDHHMIFWIAPILGSITATILYKLLLSKPIPENLRKPKQTFETTNRQTEKPARQVEKSIEDYGNPFLEPETNVKKSIEDYGNPFFERETTDDKLEGTELN